MQLYSTRVGLMRFSIELCVCVFCVGRQPNIGFTIFGAFHSINSNTLSLWHRSYKLTTTTTTTTLAASTAANKPLLAYILTHRSETYTLSIVNKHRKNKPFDNNKLFCRSFVLLCCCCYYSDFRERAREMRDVVRQLIWQTMKKCHHQMSVLDDII